MQGENTRIGNARAQAPVSVPSRHIPAARKPSGTEPASPRNTRAGGKFHARKPADAEAIAAQANASGHWRAAAAATASAPNPIHAIPPARPSEPSMKL